MSDAASRGARAQTTDGCGRPNLTVLLVGVAIILLAAILAAVVISASGKTAVHVRPATSEEMAASGLPEGSVVGAPGEGDSAVPALTAVAIRLALLGLLAAIGAGFASWGFLKGRMAPAGLVTGRRQGDETGDGKEG